MDNLYLHLKHGERAERIPLVSKAITVGRGSDNIVALEDGRASRNHCVFEPTPHGWRLRDLESRNGTRHNGKPANQVDLKPGDVVQVGAAVFTVVAAPPPTPVRSLPAMRESSPSDGHSGARPRPAAQVEAVASYEPKFDEIQESNEISLKAMAQDPGGYERALERSAEALPPGGIEEFEIEMTNARGTVVHRPYNPASLKKPRDPVNLWRLMLLICFRSRTSDIHLEPRQDAYHARLRVDGSMVDIACFPKEVGLRLANLVKILSDIDIQYKDAIQEGHFTACVPAPGGDRKVNYRVSFAPSVYGQKLVVRVLDDANAPKTIDELDMPRWMVDEANAAIAQDSGMVILCGPTGSGKTTTLYSLLRGIDIDRRNVCTIEDPVEIQLDGVTQIPVDEEQGKGFAPLLRSLLRQDPDVIMVGEVRDAETARTAMQAAMTGHLVLTTVHTKDSVGTVFRFLDLGIEPFLICQGLQLVIAQRLVRQLCPTCKRPVPLTPLQRTAMGRMASNLQHLYEPKGCLSCLGTGYSGRHALFELLVVNDKIRSLIQASPNAQAFTDALVGTDFVSLQQNGLELVAQGKTSFAEVEQVTGRIRG